MTSQQRVGGSRDAARNQEATIYCGNLDERVSEPILWELFVQIGLVVNVFIPKDRVSQTHQGFGFVEFVSGEDADYACKIMNMIKLYGRPMRINKASADKQTETGASLFIGNLAPEVDETMLQETFNAFGIMTDAPKVGRDPDSGMSKGFAFVNYATFDSADNAIASMNGQFYANRQVQVGYAFKKDGKGERHGSAAERLLAGQAKIQDMDRQQKQMSQLNAQGSSAHMPPILGMPSMGIPPPPMMRPPPQHY